MDGKTLRLPFNPVKRAEEIENLVMRGRERVYHRFRAAPYYGGVATADALGCNFLCAYCWNYSKNLRIEQFTTFYSPKQVASRLMSISRKKSYRMFRITGSESILGEASFEHLIRVLKIILEESSKAVFILETNGFVLGYRKDLIERLRFPNLNIRVSIKGVDGNSFEKITGARKEFFPYPLLALQEMERLKMSAWPAVMLNIFEEADIACLRGTLKEYGIKSDLEFELLEAYPFVVENMQKRKVRIVSSSKF